MEVPNQGHQPEVQDAGRHAGHEALDFVRHNIHAVSITVGLVLLVAVIVMAYVTQQRRSSETASQQLGVADSSKQLEELLAQYPSSSAAPIAMLALAARHFESGAYDQSVIQYIHFLQQYPKHSMAAMAKLGKVMCFEARGETEQALTGFTRFVKDHPGHFLLPQALMGEARCLQQANRMTEARALYEDFIVAHPDSEWKSQMEMAMSFMEREQREAKEKASPVPPAFPVQAGVPLTVPGAP